MSRIPALLEDAMQSASPALALRASMQTELARGVDRATLLSELTDLLSQTTEREADVLREVADFLVGWCRPDMRL